MKSLILRSEQSERLEGWAASEGLLNQPVRRFTG
jgi:hypothetical protein